MKRAAEDDLSPLPPPAARDAARHFLELDADLSGDASADEDDGSDVGDLIDDGSQPEDPGSHRRLDAARDVSVYSDSEEEGEGAGEPMDLLSAARRLAAVDLPDARGERRRRDGRVEAAERSVRRVSKPAREVRRPRRNEEAAPDLDAREAAPEEVADWNALLNARDEALGNRGDREAPASLRITRSPYRGISPDFPVSGRPIVFDVTPGDMTPNGQLLDSFATGIPPRATPEQVQRAISTRARRYLFWLVVTATQAYATVIGGAEQGMWTPEGAGGTRVPTMSLVLERLYTDNHVPLQGYRVIWIPHAPGLNLDELLDRLIQRTALEYARHQEAAAVPNARVRPFCSEEDHTCFRAIRSRADMYSKVLFPLAGAGASPEVRRNIEALVPQLHAANMPFAPTAILTLDAACADPQLVVYQVSAAQRDAEAYREAAGAPAWQGEAVLADPGCVPRRSPLPAAAQNWFAGAVEPSRLRRMGLPSSEGQLRRAADEPDEDDEIFGADEAPPPPLPAEGDGEDVDLLVHVAARNRAEKEQIEELCGNDPAVLREELTRFRRRALTTLLDTLRRPASQPVLPEALRAVLRYIEEVPTLWDEMPHIFDSSEMSSADQFLVMLMSMLEGNFALRPGVLSRHLLLMLISSWCAAWGSNENRPHMLLTGMPGIGKSMLMLAVQAILVPGSYIVIHYLSPKVLTAGSTLYRWYVVFMPEAPAYLLGIGKILNEEAYEVFKEILSNGRIASLVMELRKIEGPDGQEKTIRARASVLSDQSGVYIMATNSKIPAGREDPKDRYPVLNRCITPQPGNFRTEVSALQAALEAATRPETAGKRKFIDFMRRVHALIFLVEVAITTHCLPDVDLSLAVAWAGEMSDFLTSMNRPIEAVRFAEQFKATCRTWTIACAVWAATQTELNRDIRWDENGNEVRGLTPQLFEAILPMLVTTSPILAHVTSLYEDMLLPITRAIIRRTCARSINEARSFAWRKTADGTVDEDYVCVSDAGMDVLVARICRQSRGIVQPPGVRQEFETMAREVVSNVGGTKFLLVRDQAGVANSAANKMRVSMHRSAFEGLVNLEDPGASIVADSVGQQARGFRTELRTFVRPNLPYEMEALLPGLHATRDWALAHEDDIKRCDVDVLRLARRLDRLMQSAEQPDQNDPSFDERFRRLLANLEQVEERDAADRVIAQRGQVGDAIALGYASRDRPFESTTPLISRLRGWLSHEHALRQQLISTQALPMPDGTTRQSMCAFITVAPEAGRILMTKKRLPVSMLAEVVSAYTWNRGFEGADAFRPDVYDGPTDDVVTERFCHLHGIQLGPHQLPSRRMEYVSYVRLQDPSYAGQIRLTSYPHSLIELDDRRRQQVAEIMQRVEAYNSGEAGAYADVMKHGVRAQLEGREGARLGDAAFPRIRAIQGHARNGRRSYERLAPSARRALMGPTPGDLY